MYKTLIIIIVVLAIAIAIVAGFNRTAPETPEKVMTPESESMPPPVSGKKFTPPLPESPGRKPVVTAGFTFSTPKKSAHYESNTPAHGAILGAVPVNVVIDVNFDLVLPSSISITKEGKEYGIGGTIIDANKLAVRREMDPGAPDGLYQVTYNACWPDKSCHQGYFEFAIDRSASSASIDMRGNNEVMVRMANIAFGPKDIIISKGTKITWQNDDTVEHYVNTDAHPSHTYFPKQNSKELKKGDTYSLAFDTPGAYPYHCSAHASVMTATIIVE